MVPSLKIWCPFIVITPKSTQTPLSSLLPDQPKPLYRHYSQINPNPFIVITPRSTQTPLSSLLPDQPKPLYRHYSQIHPNPFIVITPRSTQTPLSPLLPDPPKPLYRHYSQIHPNPFIVITSRSTQTCKFSANMSTMSIQNLSMFDNGCPWYNGYRRMKLTWRTEFKSWTRSNSFHNALISLGEV